MQPTLAQLTALAESRVPDAGELVDQLPVAVLVCDLAGSIVRRNQAYGRLFADPAPHGLGHLRDLFDDAGRARLPELIGSAFLAASNGRPGPDDLVTNGLRLDGAPFRCGLTIRVVGADQPGGAYLVAVLRPINEEARRADRLRRSEHRFATLLAHLPVGIIGSESGIRADYVNATGAEVLGADTEELLGMGWLDMFHPADTRRASDAVEEALAERRPAFVPLRVIGNGDGSPRWVHLRVAPMGIGDDLGFVASIEDVSEARNLTEALAHQAHHDLLTGLLNRSVVEERVEECLAGATVDGARPAVVFVDLDDFKDVNDGLGHLIGDRVLEVSADRLFAACHPYGAVARFGGDEFVVIFPHVPSAPAALEAARRVVGALSQPVHVNGHEVHLTASAGVVWLTSEDLVAIDATEVLRRADLALYQAKRSGKHQAKMADDTMLAAERRRLRMTRALRRAINDDLLEVHYQPIVDLQDERIVGLEALVRWNDPELGRISPELFIPTAEENGMVAALGRNVLRRALADLSGWRDLPGYERLYVSVNMSMHELDEQAVARHLANALGEAELPASALYVELTESALLRRETTTVERLDAIRRLGIRLAIDDFGTGYSSLARLRRLPVDLVKIDREFVRNLGGDDQAAAIVHAIAGLAAAMGLTTVAEGIETEAQRHELCRVAGGFGQGYLFSAPIPPEAVPELLGRRPLRRAA